MEQRLTVFGTPKPAGSKNGFPFKRANGKMGVRMVDASGKAGADWRAAIVGAAKEAGLQKVPDGGPVWLHLQFNMPRPKSHYKPSGDLRDTAPRHCTVRPDTTKLIRAVEDALNGIAWDDDSQVVWQYAKKEYADEANLAGVSIWIEWD